MSTVRTHLLQPTRLVVGLLLLALLAALAALAWAAGSNDTVQLVGPFRWVPLDQLA